MYSSFRNRKISTSARNIFSLSPKKTKDKTTDDPEENSNNNNNNNNNGEEEDPAVEDDDHEVQKDIVVNDSKPSVDVCHDVYETKNGDQPNTPSSSSSVSSQKTVTASTDSSASHKTAETPPKRQTSDTLENSESMYLVPTGKPIPINGQLDAYYRKSQFQILKAFELRRRPTYLTQIEDMAIFLQAMLGRLSKQLDEMERIEKVLRIRIEADEQYALFMLNALKACDVHMEERSTENKYTNSENGLIEEVKDSVDDNRSDGSDTKIKGDSYDRCFVNIVAAEEDERNDNEKNMSRTSMKGKNYVDALSDHFDKLWNRYDDSTQKIQIETIEDVQEVKEKIQHVLTQLQSLDNIISIELKLGNDVVETSWQEYERLLQMKTSKNFSTDSSCSVDFHPDTWLHESRYRIAVGQLYIIWANCQGFLHRIYVTVEELEATRRICLREVATSLVQSDNFDQFYESHSHDEGLRSFAGNSLNSYAMKDQLLEELNQDACAIRGLSTSTENYFSPRISNLHVRQFKMNLSSPLLNSLLKYSFVMVRSDRAAYSSSNSWQKSLAVVTHDKYLLMFDLNEAKDSWPPAEAAFSNLINPTEAIEVQNGQQTSKRKWHELINPNQSMYLDDCSLEVFHRPYKETYAIITVTSRKKTLFKKTVRKKYYMRAEHEDKLLYWVDILQNDMTAKT